MAKLTKDQRDVLTELDAGPKSSDAIAVAINARRENAWFGYDKAHSSLRRLEDRGFVRRIGERPIRWELTHEGRSAVAAYDATHDDASVTPPLARP